MRRSSRSRCFGGDAETARAHWNGQWAQLRHAAQEANLDDNYLGEMNVLPKRPLPGPPDQFVTEEQVDEAVKIIVDVVNETL